MRKRLIALDIDGTLLDNARRIPDENIQAIKEAQRAGHMVMICSGRPHDSLLTFLKEEGMPDLPVSASNGSLTIVEGKIIHQVSMDLLVVEQLVAFLEKGEYPYNVFTEEGVVGHSAFLKRSKQALTDNPEQAQAMLARGMDYDGLVKYMAQVVSNHFTEWQEFPTERSVVKLYIYTPCPEKKAALTTFAATLPDLTVTSSFPDNIEISAAAGHKGTGVMAVADYFNIPIADTVAVGDNFNDKGMFETAGFGIAMGNAEAEIKELADVVTLPNDEFGVAHAIRTFIL